MFAGRMHSVYPPPGHVLPDSLCYRYRVIGRYLHGSLFASAVACGFVPAHA